MGAGQGITRPKDGMKIRILTITQKVPVWIKAGCDEYTKRLPASCSLEIIEISAKKRLQNSDIKRITKEEGEKMLSLIAPQDYVVALDVKGKAWSTEQLASELRTWQSLGQNVNLLIGGADGLAEACLQRANSRWSLSALTFPHILVRLILAEQIYRAWSITQNHPYHRG